MTVNSSYKCLMGGQGEGETRRQGDIVLNFLFYLLADYPMFWVHNHIDQFTKDIVVGHV